MDDGTRPPLWGAADEPADLGALLLLLRRAHGLTQAELADAAGVPRRFVVDLENGRSTLFVQRLHAVLDALDARLVVEEPGARDAASGLSRTGASGDDAVAVDDDPDGGAPALKDLGW
ncbi:helix-turn-helix domain-containing protein [Mobilicoccus pelagius]|uniref:Putative Xre family DNA-binding protein n=1 Tax=Mobilicoccus pelagius NBRC 104925 TaxID=1089455 RepID=H5US10_9MICO|nr:helix-turn-helix domain-containing protein [Mobilicoccus pelagius]GAB48518.1 putative Xre family DNA-binding protein [Mobilicoccus pelagius NBRC 104925]